jgi:chemotaxis protein methyltransferase CheR
VQTRMGKLMRKRDIDGFQELFEILEQDSTGQEMISVVDAICTNHTYFFREEEHFTFLVNDILPDLLEGSTNKRELRIWSAGCSTGEEPYTLAIALSEAFKKYPNRTFSIFASDLSTKAIYKASRGIYDIDEVETLPQDLKKKYFQRGKGKYESYVRVKPVIKQHISFRRHNLLKTLESEPNFDVIFCRNVMIYFDFETKQRVVDRLAEKLSEGGYFISGHSESLSTIEHKFTMIRPTVYKNV